MVISTYFLFSGTNFYDELGTKSKLKLSIREKNEVVLYFVNYWLCEQKVGIIPEI